VTAPTPDLARLRRRYSLLLVLRWLPAGMIFPVIVLLGLERGLSLAEIGLAAAAQGIVVLLLELPTGGLADTLGRRPVLLVAILVNAASLALFSVADTLPLYLAFFVLQGVYRALDSGPLESWYVDAMLAADPRAPIERGLGGGGVVLGGAMGVGALTTGAIIWLDLLPAGRLLVIPVYLALATTVVEFVAVAVLVRGAPTTAAGRRVRASLTSVPAVIRDATRLALRSRVLVALLVAEFLWGIGAVTFETLTPARLLDVVGSVTTSAAIMGPLVAVAWLASSLGAGLAVPASRRWGVAATAAVLRAGQGLAVVGLAYLGGLAGLITAYLFCYATHGGANPMHMALLHQHVPNTHRTTVASLNSMAGRPGSTLGLIGLTALAGATSLPTALLVGALVLAAAAPLYLVARRQPAGTEPAAAPAERSTD
jgi:MFS family permease